MFLPEIFYFERLDWTYSNDSNRPIRTLRVERLDRLELNDADTLSGTSQTPHFTTIHFHCRKNSSIKC